MEGSVAGQTTIRIAVGVEGSVAGRDCCPGLGTYYRTSCSSAEKQCVIMKLVHNTQQKLRLLTPGSIMWEHNVGA